MRPSASLLHSLRLKLGYSRLFPSFSPKIRLVAALFPAAFLSVPSPSFAAASESPVPSRPETETSLVAPSLACMGQNFQLAQSYGNSEVETHEYVLEGESLRDWSQLVTVQRLTTPSASRPGDFVAFSSQRLTREGGTTVLTQPSGKRTSLFTAHFNKSPDHDEQVVVCLVFSSPADPTRLQILQYAAKPARLTPPQLESQLRAWRERLQSQAQLMEKSQTEAGR